MSIRPLLALFLLVLALAVSAAEPPGADEEARPEDPRAPEGPALFLEDGTVVPCLEAPVLAFGRAVYTTTDGVRHSTAVDLVDVRRTRAHALKRTADRELGAPPPPAAASSAAPASSTAGRKPAPDFELERPDGETVQLSDYRGKVVLIDFWASWCGPCVRALPELMEIKKGFADRDLQVVGVSLDRSREKYEQFVRRHGMDFPQNFDGKQWNNEVARLYGVRSIPRTVLLDREGRIAQVNARGRALQAAIERLLAEGGAERGQAAGG